MRAILAAALFLAVMFIGTKFIGFISHLTSILIWMFISLGGAGLAFMIASHYLSRED